MYLRVEQQQMRLNTGLESLYATLFGLGNQLLKFGMV